MKQIKVCLADIGGEVAKINTHFFPAGNFRTHKNLPFTPFFKPTQSFGLPSEEAYQNRTALRANAYR
jgi:hypothetical protein